MIALHFNDVKFNVEFGRIVAGARNPQPLLLGAGREVANQLKKHFRTKDKSQPNALSARRSHFWLAVANSVQVPQVEGNTVTVAINHPAFAQKLYGGTIRAKASKALTIPVEERAYGRRASTFEAETGLKLILIRTGGSGFENAVLAVKDKNGGLTVEYVLTPSVTQKADPGALPLKSALEAAILARAQRMQARQLDDNPLES